MVRRSRQRRSFLPGRWRKRRSRKLIVESCYKNAEDRVPEAARMCLAALGEQLCALQRAGDWDNPLLGSKQKGPAMTGPVCQGLKQKRKTPACQFDMLLV